MRHYPRGSNYLFPLSQCPQLLEYVGKGKSIMDVGLAQARQPLTTRCHYFEVEIVDAGEKCYIALGLARRVSFLGTLCRQGVKALQATTTTTVLPSLFSIFGTKLWLFKIHGSYFAHSQFALKLKIKLVGANA